MSLKSSTTSGQDSLNQSPIQADGTKNNDPNIQTESQVQDRSISVSSDTSSSYQSLKEDNEKLNKRLLLLRDEYVKLQKKFLNLQMQYDYLITSKNNKLIKTSENGETESEISSERCALELPPSYPTEYDRSINANLISSSSTMNFIQKIVEFIGSLYDNELYSDLLIDYQDGKKQLRAHKFVLLFRSQEWSVPNLKDVDRLSFPEMTQDIADPLFRWVYTGYIPSFLFDKSEYYVLKLVQYALRFQLSALVEQCEDSLICFVQMKNCIYFYQTSEKLGLSRLCGYSAKLVAIYWDSLTAEDFDNVTTPFLHRLFVEKSRFPLHKSIRIRNEDLVFLLLMDFDNQTSYKVNEFDNFGQLPLDLALRTEQYQIAKTLLEHQANINAVDSDGWPLAHRYLTESLWVQVKFLLEQGVSVQSTNPDGDSLLHLCADCSSQDNQDYIIDLTRMLLERHCDGNLQNKLGETALHRSITSHNIKFFDLLLDHHKLTNVNLELRNNNYDTPLALALNVLNENDDRYFAEKLLHLNVSLDTIDPLNGDSLLNQCARKCYEKAAIFLVEHGANINFINNYGESTLHLASFNGLKDLVSLLLQKNVNCNLLTLPSFKNKPKKDDFGNEANRQIIENNQLSNVQMSSGENETEDVIENDEVFNQTALHLAITGRHEAIIKEIISFHDRSSRKGCLDSALLSPDLDVKNSQHQTPLSLAVELGLMSIAELLISVGADVNVKNEKGLSLLHRMIIKDNISSAQFLLQHGIDINQMCPLTGESYLQFAIRYRRTLIVEALCQAGADVKQLTTNGDSLLWEALKLYKEDGNVEIASILIRYHSDPNGWQQSRDNGFFQTLLHRALDENNQDAAIFLIHSGCDIHCVRKPGPNSEGREDCDGQTPLHMACSWGMANVVETLLEYQVNANLTDNEGKTALHMAIANQNHPIIELLLAYKDCDPHKVDNYGQTPFALAIKLKSRKTAQALCRRDGSISEQRDGKGRNYLHLALERNDYDAVLFLLDNKIDVNARVLDSSRKAPIHLAAETGSEIILRTLLLAGSELNVLTMQNQTALHLASELDKYQIVETLLDLGIDASAQDVNGNTAFHIAAARAHHNTSRVLIKYARSLSTENKISSVDPRKTNNKGQNIIHCLATSSNKSEAANIFEELIANYSDLDLDMRDNEGNTALLLAYMNGNGKLCRAIVKEGASLGIRNNQGVSIFNHIMPTRQLLTSLLDSLVRMPNWRDGPECLECGQKFSITNRKHHCRHCGRELCSRCSSKEIIIMKFQQDKKSIQSRVCELCYDVLTLGVFN